jgi:hypothetical protein
MSTVSETHLFIIWKNARYKEKEFIEEIKNKLRIVEVCEVTWSNEAYSSNLTRFYGQKLPDRSFKEKHCGKGPFLLVICEDLSPKYNERDTISRDIERVNTNIFDLKQKFRNMTGGGHKVHATNNPIETNHDLSLLLGVNVEDYNVSQKQTWSGEISSLESDLVGCNGWESAEQLFYILNACEEYVVMRNFDGFPEKITLEGHDDVDLLVRDFDNFVYLLNGKKTFKKSYRVQYQVCINKHNVLFDIRSVGDEYFCRSWQEDILSTRTLKGEIYIPDEEMHNYSVLYHALVHKKSIANDYIIKLNSWFNTTDINKLSLILEGFLQDRKYNYVEPRDLSVYFSLSDNVSIRRKWFYFLLGFKFYIKGIIK